MIPFNRKSIETDLLISGYLVLRAGLRENAEVPLMATRFLFEVMRIF
jgi:hypothetical protein